MLLMFVYRLYSQLLFIASVVLEMTTVLTLSWRCWSSLRRHCRKWSAQVWVCCPRVSAGKLFCSRIYLYLLCMLTEVSAAPAAIILVTIRVQCNPKTDPFTLLFSLGFGFGSQVASSVVTSPQPSDQPVLVLFVLGGISYKEIGQVQQLLSQRAVPKTKIIVLCTRIVNAENVMYTFFTS